MTRVFCRPCGEYHGRPLDQCRRPDLWQTRAEGTPSESVPEHSSYRDAILKLIAAVKK